MKKKRFNSNNGVKNDEKKTNNVQSKRSKKKRINGGSVRAVCMCFYINKQHRIVDGQMNVSRKFYSIVEHYITCGFLLATHSVIIIYE